MKIFDVEFTIRASHQEVVEARDGEEAVVKAWARLLHAKPDAPWDIDSVEERCTDDEEPSGDL
jgi:hypothetical protein